MDWHTITQVLSLDNFLNWLNTLDPLVVHLINALVLFIEGIGVPGVPFEPPMLAAGILVHQGKTTLIESILWGGVANWLGNIGGYYLADAKKCDAVMRPSATLNAALASA